MKKPNITLRELHLSDAATMARLANNKKIWCNVRDHFPYPYSEKDAKGFIEMQKNNDSEKVFAIEYEGDFCGCIGLIFQKDVYRKSAEIGYWIGEPYWGRGIGTETVSQLIGYAFEKLKLVRLYAGVFEYNISSMKVLEKNGFHKEGISKSAVLKNDKLWDEHRYAKINMKMAVNK